MYLPERGIPEVEMPVRGSCSSSTLPSLIPRDHQANLGIVRAKSLTATLERFVARYSDGGMNVFDLCCDFLRIMQRIALGICSCMFQL
jgi:hypothetical protein